MSLELAGRRITLRPLELKDWPAYREVRRRNVDWLLKWEPARPAGQPDPVESRDAFAARCSARQRERQLGTGYGFGIFVRSAGGLVFGGEINLSSVQRGPFQSGHVGYWVDKAQAGRGYCPEAVVVLARFAFDELLLHRIQISIIPRNAASRRVVDKLGVRDEGVAVRYLRIADAWEDHIRYALTYEEWEERRVDLLRDWVF
ncbi:MAG: GNAT family N-acetyltransferase [Acidimicrobiales bacterium]